MNRPRLRRRPVPVQGSRARMTAAVILPAPQPGEWELYRPPMVDAAVLDITTATGPGREGTRQTFATLEALAANLQEAEPVVLTLPLEMGLIQRLSLPPAEPGELREMAEIQLEKILPYPMETVGVALQEIARSETEVVVAVATVPHDRLLTLCQPLIARGCYPVHTMFYAVAAASVARAEENSALLYRAAGRYVLGICENGRLGFAQGLGGTSPEEIAAELPAVLLGAELEGVPTNFSVLRLDERADELRGVLRTVLGIPVETLKVEPGAALVAAAGVPNTGDLSPAGWRSERLRGERMMRVRRRIMMGVGIYLGLLLLAFLALGAQRLRVGWQRSRLASLQPKSEEAQRADARWRVLAPAVDPARSVVETLFQVYQCLPADNSVLLTAYDQSPVKVEIQGEAPGPSQADDFTVKVKALPGLRAYHFEADPLAILPNNGHARFHVIGTLPAAPVIPR